MLLESGFVLGCPTASLVLESSLGFFLDLISFKVCSMERRSLLCELGTAETKVETIHVTLILFIEGL